MLDRTIAPPSATISSPNIKKAETYHLSNGQPIYFINAGDQPVVRLEIIVNSGIITETQSGISWITGKVISEGSSKKTLMRLPSYLNSMAHS